MQKGGRRTYDQGVHPRVILPLARSNTLHDDSLWLDCLPGLVGQLAARAEGATGKLGGCGAPEAVEKLCGKVVEVVDKLDGILPGTGTKAGERKGG